MWLQLRMWIGLRQQAGRARVGCGCGLYLGMRVCSFQGLAIYVEAQSSVSERQFWAKTCEVSHLCVLCASGLDVMQCLGAS